MVQESSDVAFAARFNENVLFDSHEVIFQSVFDVWISASSAVFCFVDEFADVF